MLNNLKGKTIFVTGGSGFIGSHLTAKLQNIGASVHVLSRNITQKQNGSLTWWEGDILDREALQIVVKRIDPDIIFHLASKVTGSRDRDLVFKILQTNYIGTINILDASVETQCNRVVLAGSLEEPVKKDSIPQSPYAAAKWASNICALMYHSLYNTPVVPVRIGMVYGPAQGDQAKLIPYVTLSFLQNQVPKITSGRRRVDWIYIDDVVNGLLRAGITPNIEGEVVDIATGNLKSIREIVETIAEIIQSEVSFEFGALPDRALETEFVANVERTYKILQWKPEISLSEGLERTVRWYKNNLSKIM